MPIDFGKNPNKILSLGKNLQNWENTGLLWIGKQPVKSLYEDDDSCLGRPNVA